MQKSTARGGMNAEAQPRGGGIPGGEKEGNFVIRENGSTRDRVRKLETSKGDKGSTA